MAADVSQPARGRGPTYLSAWIESHFRRAAEPLKRGGYQLDSESTMAWLHLKRPSPAKTAPLRESCASRFQARHQPALETDEATRVTRLQQASNVFFCQLTATKKNPGAGTLPGLCRLLPQLVVRSGRRRGVGGWVTPSGLTTLDQRSRSNASRRNVAVVPILLTASLLGRDRGSHAASRSGGMGGSRNLADREKHLQ
jgi:hypothetical protein